MFEVLPQSSGNVIAVRVNGKLMHADYEQFVPQLESLIQQHGSLRCYCEIGNYQGVSFRAIWDELKFDVTHCNQIERCAVVGDSTWQKWMTNMSKVLFHKAQIRYFTEDQADEAWDWVNQGVPCCCAGVSAFLTKTNAMQLTVLDTERTKSQEPRYGPDPLPRFSFSLHPKIDPGVKQPQATVQIAYGENATEAVDFQGGPSGAGSVIPEIDFSPSRGPMPAVLSFRACDTQGDATLCLHCFVRVRHHPGSSRWSDVWQLQHATQDTPQLPSHRRQGRRCDGRWGSAQRQPV